VLRRRLPGPALLLAQALGGEARAALRARRVEDAEIGDLANERRLLLGVVVVVVVVAEGGCTYIRTPSPLAALAPRRL